ncbi:MAG: T9SS type A sorting domain-containing protein [Bacteroidales bacterium]|nr:T9SS type A sorting domain-containing protein [Bacteroidales bacterium]
MKILKVTLLLLIGLLMFTGAVAQEKKKKVYQPESTMPAKYRVDKRIDNMGYWRRMALEGLVPVAPEAAVPPAIKRSSRLLNGRVLRDDSPDVPVTTVNSTQSENSVFINPNDKNHVLNSNNSTQNPVGSLYGANDFYSFDSGITWLGEVQGAGGANSGDPTTAINLDGRMFVGYIHSNGGQGVSWSDDNGASWTPVLVANAPAGYGSLLDKNHMWIDNSPSSPYVGYLYDAWTPFGGTNDTEIELSRSTTHGESWEPPVNVATGINAGSHNQGVNIQTGPNGEVYVIWAVYDSWPSDESTIAMARSWDGGATWEAPRRIITNIRGIRTTGTSKAMRVNSFPSMAVDISNGPNSGNIYITWTNVGVPGINNGPDKDVYMARSDDNGETFSTPVKVNQDEPGLGKEHYFPWITCDPVSGNLAVVFYDDRNVSANQCEVFCATSIDGGVTWEDFRVSDVAFTPQPIPGLASDYMGDYLGIAARDRMVYPVWTDNRSGITMTYVSPFELGPPPDQPWVIFHDVLVNDANQRLDFNESVPLNVSMVNIGDQIGNDVQVTLSTQNQYITIDNNLADFGTLDLEEIKTIENAFTISSANNIPNGEKVDFTLTAVDANDSTFISGFNLTAFAPEIAFGAMIINDAQGNANGRIDAGETVDLHFMVSNPGAFDIDEVVATLLSPSPYITLNTQSVAIGLIPTGEEIAVTFSVSADAQTPMGTSVEFILAAEGGAYSAQKAYLHVIGLILEDWESGDFSGFDWQMSGSGEWILVEDVVFEGTYSAQSGSIDHQSSVTISLDYNVMRDDSLSFYYKVSSEASYDYLRFTIDGNIVGQWSGEVDWTRAAYPVTEGLHTFAWEYAKDYMATGGSDCGWIDYIVLPPELVTSAYAGDDIVTCDTAPVILDQAAATYVTSILWETDGSGTFDDPQSLNPQYHPSNDDLASGLVALTLNVTGPELTLSDMLQLTLNPSVVAVIAGEASVCSNELYEISGIEAESYTSIMWSTRGDGSFDDPSALRPVYTPGTNDLFTGSVTLSVLLSGYEACGDWSGEQVLTIYEAPAAILSGGGDLCYGDSIPLSVTLTGTAPWSLILGNGEIIEGIESSPWLHYVAPDTTMAYTLQSVSGANGCTRVAEGIATVTVHPLPVVELGPDTAICHNHTILLDAGTDGTSYIWSTGETDQTIAVDSTGVGIGGVKMIYVEVSNAFSCSTSDTIQITFNDCTGIDDFATYLGLAVYPNPVSEELSVLFSSPESKEYYCEIRDGRNAMVAAFSTGRVAGEVIRKVNVAHLPDGIYMMTLRSGVHVASCKIVIQH